MAVVSLGIEKRRVFLHVQLMNFGFLWAMPIVCGVALFSGCQKPGNANANTNSPPVTNEQYHLNRAQRPLPTVKLWLGKEELQTEVATTVTQVATGMMFREKMGENEAMLFVFGTTDQRGFYMKNCKVPLSAAYIDPEGTILEIVSLHPGVEAPVTSQSDKVQYVLEVNQGWFERHKVPTNSVIRTERGTLRQSFAGQAMLR